MNLAMITFITGFLATLAISSISIWLNGIPITLCAGGLAIAGGFVYSRMGLVKHMDRMRDPEYAKQAMADVGIEIENMENMGREEFEESLKLATIKLRAEGFDHGVESLLDSLRESSIVISTKGADPILIGMLNESGVKLIPDAIDSPNCQPEELFASILLLAASKESLREAN